MEKKDLIWGILVPTSIGYILTVIFSYYTWVGIIIGPPIAGYLAKRYLHSLIDSIIIGLTAWPTVFLLKQLAIGETYTKALSIAGFFYMVAILIGFLLALFSGILGASIRNILDDTRQPKAQSST